MALGDDEPAKAAEGEASTDWFITIQAAKRLKRELDMTDAEWSEFRAVLAQRHDHAWGAYSAAH